MKTAVYLLAGALLVAGCAHPSTSTYDPADVGRTIETAQGSVVSSRIVNVTGETSAAGPVAGGALGGATSGLVFKSGWAAIIGGVIGAGAGYLTQQTLNNREGIEYLVEMDDGRTVTIVQNRESAEMPLPDGTPVLVQYSGKYTRVVPDPRGGQKKAGGWVDPDTAGGSPSSPGRSGSRSSSDTVNPVDRPWGQQ